MTDRDLLRASQAVAPNKPTLATSAARKEGGGRERGQPAAAELPTPTLHNHTSRATTSATPGLADRRDVTAACPATYPSHQSTGLAFSRGMGISNTLRMMARADNSGTNIPSSPHLPRSALKPALPLPPTPPLSHPPSRPAQIKHPSPLTPAPVAPTTRTPRAAHLEEVHEEYMSADSVRLARAPEAARVVHRAVLLANGVASYADRQHWDELSHAPLVACLTSPGHPPPSLPPPRTLQSPGSYPPTPTDWPFPISVTEMGWVLAAVVMARNMDREEARRRQEYDDDDYLSMWEPSSEDEGAGDATSHDNNSAATFTSAPNTTLSERDDTGTVTYDGGYTDTIAGSASPAPSLATTLTGSDHDNAHIQDWDETSDLSFNEPGEFIYDNEEYEQDPDGHISEVC
ncbi:hypothetical protein EV714DRAFT_277968 [Schizophyllum commune]